MKELRIAGKLVTTLLKDRMHYPVQLFAETSLTAIRLGVVLLLYSYVYALNGGHIRGTVFEVAAWSMFLYFALMAVSIRNIARTIMADIRSGAIETLYNKPVSYLWYRTWWQIGAGIHPFVVTSVVGGIAMYALVGIPESMHSALFLGTLSVAFVGGLLLMLVVYTSVGLLAFWMDDIDPVFWIVDKAIMMLGGSYVPVALMPASIQALALYSPFGAMNFISHTVYDSWATEWHLYLGVQMCWIAAIGVLVWYLFAQASRKLSVNGG